MSKFRELVEEIKHEQVYDKDTLDEGLGKTLGTLATAAAIGLGGLQGADAKTNPDLLRRSGHEITTQYEHGGQGYAAITKDNYGGFSYGKEQLSTRRLDDAPSTFDKFLDYLSTHLPDAYNKLEKAGGWDAAFVGQTSFRKAWLDLIKDKKFTDCYDDFVTDTMILPVYNRMDQAKTVNLDKVTTWGSENPAVQAAIRSVIIQHGRVGAFNLIKKVVKQKNPQNPNEFLDALYELRAKKFSKYKTRYANEHKALNSYLNSLTTNTKPTKLT